MDIDDVKAYAGQNARSWSDDDLTDALAAETAAQARVCVIPDPVPADLDQALKRRVVRNLAMRQYLSQDTIGDAEIGPPIVPGRDPEVRRFEAPFRRLVVG